MKKKLASKNLSTFESIFLGEFVTILTTIQTKKVIQNDDHIQEDSSPLAFDGFLIDTDEFYYYLGVTPKEAAIAIRIDTVLSVIISDESIQQDSILDSLSDKPKDSEIN